MVKIEGIGRSVIYDNHASLRRLLRSRYHLSIFTLNLLFKLQIYSRKHHLGFKNQE